MAADPIAATITPRPEQPARRRRIDEAAGSDRPPGTTRWRKKAVDVASTLASSLFLFAVTAVQAVLLARALHRGTRRIRGRGLLYALVDLYRPAGNQFRHRPPGGAGHVVHRGDLAVGGANGRPDRAGNDARRDRVVAGGLAGGQTALGLALDRLCDDASVGTHTAGPQCGGPRERPYGPLQCGPHRRGSRIALAPGHWLVDVRNYREKCDTSAPARHHDRLCLPAGVERGPPALAEGFAEHPRLAAGSPPLRVLRDRVRPV